MMLFILPRQKAEREMAEKGGGSFVRDFLEIKNKNRILRDSLNFSKSLLMASIFRYTIFYYASCKCGQ